MLTHDIALVHRARRWHSVSHIANCSETNGHRGAPSYGQQCNNHSSMENSAFTADDSFFAVSDDHYTPLHVAWPSPTPPYTPPGPFLYGPVDTVYLQVAQCCYRCVCSCTDSTGCSCFAIYCTPCCCMWSGGQKVMLEIMWSLHAYTPMSPQPMQLSAM